MSDIKQCFESRFKDGLLVVADFSQLEVIGAGMMSEDPLLEEDILSGRDTHRFFAAQLFNKPEAEVTKGERTHTKRMTFQLQYGAGAKSMSEKLGLAKAVAQAFIDNYYGRYVVLAGWQDRIMEAVKRSRKPTEAHLPSGLPQGRGEYESPTGRVYVFLEKDKPEGWRGKDLEPDFNPPEVKNYPIQGFATGDVMALFRGRVYRRLLADPFLWEKALPVNTVHDNVMFDCYDKEVAERVRDLLKEEAAKLPKIVNELWGIKAILPLKIDIEAGPNWADTHAI